MTDMRSVFKRWSGHMVYELELNRVTKENFSDFGIYLEEPEGTPDYSDSLFDWWNACAEAETGGDISFGFVLAKPCQEPVQEIFEQHRGTPEVLIPLDRDIIIIVGKPKAFEGIPEKENFRAFTIPKGTAVILSKGVWHYAPAVVSDPARIMVIFKKGTSEKDKLVKDLSTYGMLVKVRL
jgi:ureidoglycolate hydrolase